MRQTRLIPRPILNWLGQVIEANGRGVEVDGYPREYLIGAGLCRPTSSGLVHTPQALPRFRKDARAYRVEDSRRASAQALDKIFSSSQEPAALFREILRTGHLP